MSSTALEIKSKAVRAGAGAGKTYNLTHQVLDYACSYYKEHGQWPHVMVTTFTRKATQELSERLVELALTERQEALEFATSSLFLKISTIHGILDSFLKEHGHKIDLCGDFTYLKKSEANFLSRKALKDIIDKDESFTDILGIFKFSHLHSMLEEALHNDLEGFRVLQRTDLDELLSSHLSSIDMRLICMATQIKEAELTPKWSKIGEQLVSVSFLLKNWEEHRQEALDIISQIKLVGLKSKKNEQTYILCEELSPLVKDLKKLTESFYDPKTFDFFCESNKKFSDLLKEFKFSVYANKKIQGKIEISDLEPLALELLRQRPEAAKEYSKNWNYWLVDEFQDTSPVQVEILDRLIADRPFYVVGDPQQSIYLFRGARSEVFNKKISDVEKAKGSVEFLEKNYRSSPDLLHFINLLSKNLGSDFKPMVPALEETHSESVCQFSILDSTKDRGIDRDNEMESAGVHIARLRKQGADFGQMCILVRKNKDLEDVGNYLRSKNIPVHLHASGLFWQRREIQDALCLLKFIINPYDDYNLACLLRQPIIASTDAEIFQCFNEREGAAWPKVSLRFREGKAYNSGKILCKWFDLRDKYGVVVVFQRLLMELGAFDTHLARDKSERIEGNLWKFIHLLKSFEQQRGANFTQFINEAARSVGQERVSDAIGAVDTDKVNVMTVHASKGLQFDYVLLPFLGKSSYQEKKLDFIIDEEERVWSVRAPILKGDIKTSASLFEKKVIKKKAIKENAEDYRVFYVAFTRAKRALYMSWTNPYDKESWASFLKDINLSEGAHETELFNYSVSSKIETMGEYLLSSEKVYVKKPLKSLRANYPEEQVSEPTAVTKAVGSMSTYKDAFLNKQRGILFHKLLETLKYPRGADMKELILEWFPDDVVEVGEALSYLLNHQEIPVVELIKQGEVEWPFVTMSNERRIEGQIDLWGVVGSTLWIIDYKSGKKILKDKSFAQLEHYAKAVTSYLDWQGEIRLSVIYPFVKQAYTQNYKS